MSAHEYIRTRRALPLAVLAAFLLTLGACGGEDSPVAPAEPEEDVIQRLTVNPGTLSITGSCDHDSLFESSGNGEFSFRFLVQLDGSEERVSFARSETWNEGSHEAPGGNLVFTRNVTQGEDFILRFEGTEFDGALGSDAQFRSLVSERVYAADATGRWERTGRLTLTGGKAQCGANLTYTISWQGI